MINGNALTICFVVVLHLTDYSNVSFTFFISGK